MSLPSAVSELAAPSVLTGSLGGSPLSVAGRAGRLPQWFPPLPSDRDGWTAYGEAVRGSVAANGYDALRDAVAPTGKAAERLARSVGGKGLVITTGQQPGLFGGPLMSLVKALSARALADELTAHLGVPVAPVFWAATDDADFDEAAVVSVSLAGGARELRLDERAPAGTPMSRVPMGDDIATAVALLRDACGSAPHASYLEAALHEYRSGVTVGDAYVALLRTIFEPLEIAVLDASHPSVSRASGAFLRRTAHEGAAVADAVRARNAEIEAAGFAPQVVEVPGLSLVALNESGIKRRVPLDEAAGQREPTGRDYLSSTVLLRPVLERFLLPTAAYVAGPGEFAYFAQVTAVATALGVPVPRVVPRWSTTILEPRVQRMLDALGVQASELSDPHAVENRLARERMSPALADALQTLRADVERGVDAVRFAASDVVPPAVVDGVRRSVDHRLERLERRIAAAVKRRETDLMRDVATARGALSPHGSPQERKLAYVPFLARYGAPLLTAMLASARAHARLIVHSASADAPSRSAAAKP